MAGVAQIPRSRGTLCGVLLVLLGLWGGLAPFVGPYFHFGFTPDKAWAYTSGRLYLSAAPGAAALIGGLLVVSTRSRAAGVVGGLLAAVGGAWFIVGYATVVDALKSATISPGLPLPQGAGSAGVLTISVMRSYLEQLSFFAGLGVLIIFLAALAMGRFSMVSAKDAAMSGAAGYGPYQGIGGQDQFPSASDDTQAAQPQYPPATGQFPSASGSFSAAQEQYPSATGQFPPVTQQQFPPQDQFPSSDS
jgi:hypothetical protein